MNPSCWTNINQYWTECNNRFHDSYWLSCTKVCLCAKVSDSELLTQDQDINGSPYTRLLSSYRNLASSHGMYEDTIRLSWCNFLHSRFCRAIASWFIVTNVTVMLLLGSQSCLTSASMLSLRWLDLLLFVGIVFYLFHSIVRIWCHNH